MTLTLKLSKVQERGKPSHHTSFAVNLCRVSSPLSTILVTEHLNQQSNNTRVPERYFGCHLRLQQRRPADEHLGDSLVFWA